MTTKTVPPALDADEWAPILAHPEKVPAMLVALAEVTVKLDCPSPPQLMALANFHTADDHPGKITRADVQMLRALLVAFEPNDHVNDWLPALADKLEALLPPVYHRQASAGSRRLWSSATTGRGG